jgi:ATP-binding cassette subfamily F protein 1
VQEEKELLRKLEVDGVKDPKLDERLGVVYTELANMNADSAESKARRILSGLGFTEKDQSKATKHFSGGWRMRISLAKALFIEPTLLMLDEPTNHLDLNAVIWLDDYLQKYKNTVLIISHDQDFLNSVCQEILHLFQTKIDAYKGNYDTFKALEETKRKQQLKAYEKQEKRLQQLKKANVSKGNAEKEVVDSDEHTDPTLLNPPFLLITGKVKKKQREAGARSQKKDKSKGQMQENVTTELIQRPKDYTVQLTFKNPTELVPPILEVRDVNWKWPGATDYLFKDLNFGRYIYLWRARCVVRRHGL